VAEMDFSQYLFHQPTVLDYISMHCVHYYSLVHFDHIDLIDVVSIKSAENFECLVIYLGPAIILLCLAIFQNFILLQEKKVAFAIGESIAFASEELSYSFGDSFRILTSDKPIERCCQKN